MLTPEQRQACIERIRAFPALLEAAVSGLSDEQLTTHYLPDEWTVAQNVHHVVDSHMNAYIRTRLMLTEDNPTIRPYDQDAWALLADAHQPDLSASLALLRALHTRWVTLFESLSEEQWNRPGLHPAGGAISPASIVQSYADHGEGHIDQIRRTLAAGRAED